MGRDGFDVGVGGVVVAAGITSKALGDDRG